MLGRLKAIHRRHNFGQVASFAYNASSVDTTFFVNNSQSPLRVRAITLRVDTQGSDGSAVTATVKKAASGTAIGSGTALHSGTLNLKGTDDTNQTATLSTTPANLVIPPGTAIGVDFGGTLTAAIGSVSVDLVPA